MAEQPAPETKGGFTLLEVVVAITIFGLAVSLVYVLYGSVTSIVAAVEQQASRDVSAKIILDRLSEDLTGVYMGEQGYVAGGEMGSFSGEEPVLTVTSTAHLRLNPKALPVDVTLVRYYLREQRDSETFSLLRSDTPVVSDLERSFSGEQQQHLLSAEVVELKISYIGHDGEEYEAWNSVDDFDAEQDVHERYPKGYTILLRLGTDGDEQQASTRYRTSVSIAADLIEFEGGQ